MSSQFWIIMLIILLSIVVFVSIGIIVYYRIMNRIKNDVVVRIHMTDTTIETYRFHTIPVNNEATIKEYNNRGEEASFTYLIKEECIEKGRWGRYIDFDYHILLPVNPRNRSSTNMMNELKELFRLFGSMLDTDLHVKLLRNSKFEDLVKMLLIIILIVGIIGAGVGTFNMIKSITKKSSNIQQSCVLSLTDNSTWDTIYVASHKPRITVTNPNYVTQ